MIGDNLLKSNRELQSPHSLFGIVGSSMQTGTDDYDSMYESRSALTTVQNQHFVEWFSGKSLSNVNWTLQNNTALPTVAIQDSVDDGLLMTNTGTGYGGSITFNNKRQYGGSGVNCTCIMVLKNTTANGLTYAGFDRNGAPSTSNGGMGANSTAVIEMGASTKFNLVVTNAGNNWDRTATSIATADANWHAVKIDVKASDVDLTVDGTLEATRTGVRPSTTMQPSITGRNAGANATTYIRYMECYNT